MNVPKSLVGYVSIYLGGCYACVAKHGLHRTYVCTVLQKVSCKRVTEGVRRDLFYNARNEAILFYNSLD